MTIGNPSSLPMISQPMLGENGCASRPYYLFFSSLNLAANGYSGLQSQVDAIEKSIANLPGGFGLRTTDSITQTGASVPGSIVTLSLQGDVNEASNTAYYGTDGSATKGWYPIASALLGSSNVDLTTGTDGVTTFDLTDLADSGSGSLLAITRDAKGRVSGTKAATITGTAGQIDVTNGDASAGLPTIALNASITMLLALLSAIAPTLRADDVGDYRVTDSGIYRVTA